MSSVICLSLLRAEVNDVALKIVLNLIFKFPVIHHTNPANGNSNAAQTYDCLSVMNPKSVNMLIMNENRILPNTIGHSLAPVSNSGTQFMDKLYVITKNTNTKYIKPSIHIIGFITEYVIKMERINMVLEYHTE